MNENSKPSEFTGGQPAEALLERLGRNVRAARNARKIPRRALSEASGVSPRYLAQLEAGQGNISIALLNRVARALGTTIFDLLGDASSAEEARLLRLYRAADPATRDSVTYRLEQAASLPDRAQRICLIGLRGAGKSTLGARVGARLGLSFVELNKDLEDHAGMPVSEIMALYGPEGYRRLEAEAVRRISARKDRLILAVAGGIVSDPDTYATLIARFHTIWVRTSPEEHMARVRAQGDMRPMEGQPEAMARLRDLLSAREAEYGRAEAQLDTAGQSPEASEAELLALIERHGFLA